MFLELTQRRYGNKVLINVDNIETIETSGLNKGTDITLISDYVIKVKESYDDIKKLLDIGLSLRG